MNREAFALEAVSAAETADTLRLLTCGSVDDGKSTLIGRLLYDFAFVDGGPARRSSSGLGEARHGRRGDRLRASRRRARGGARAGHHHRRRLPLLRHAAPPLHRRRYARPRSVHAQHGDRRLDRRPRDPARRRSQGPDNANSAARRDRLTGRHPRRGSRGEQDGPRRLRRRSLPRDRLIVRGLRQEARHRRCHRDPDLRARRRQCHERERTHALLCGSGPASAP